MITPTSYPCRVTHVVDTTTVGGGPCQSTASYFAIDDRARYGHICRSCWLALSSWDRSLYEAR